MVPHMTWTPRKLKFILNIYPPYFGAGIRTDYISDDWREVKVSMKLHWYNKNAVGTHFGGSLYSMVDPHIMIMLMSILGKDYIVWDKTAEIRYLNPGTSRVHAVIKISDDMISEIKNETANGDKYQPTIPIEVRDKSGKRVCLVKKTLYVRKVSERRTA